MSYDANVYPRVALVDVGGDVKVSIARVPTEDGDKEDILLSLSNGDFEVFLTAAELEDLLSAAQREIR